MKTLCALLLVTCALPATVTCHRGAIPQGDSQPISEFWSAFRKAVAAKDREAVASMTEFPFKTRGPLDRDPVMTRDRTSFLRTIEQLLDVDPGLKPEPETMRDLIKRTSEIQPSSADGNSARLGSFVFQRLKGHWRFTMAYVDE